ncbi:MAG: hypothetical protein IVW54_10740 [Candidatus Binataceae bacterium]|nr:hypothetical protein [Candidatus Binataceae bacterium]
MKQAQPGSCGGLEYAALLLITTIGLIFFMPVNPVFADPLTVPAASTSWERFDPTLEIPRIYNPDGSLPPNAEMPFAVMPASPATSASSTASSPASESLPIASSGASSSNVNNPPGASSATGNSSTPDADPESALNAPSGLDPNNVAIGNAEDYQAGQVSAPAVEMMPVPYAVGVPMYQNPYYGNLAPGYPAAYAPYGSAPQPIQPYVFGAMNAPGYRRIGPLVTPWRSAHTSAFAPSRPLMRGFPNH